MYTAWDGDSIVVTTTGTILEGTLVAGTAVESLDPTNTAGAWTELTFNAQFDGAQNQLSFELTPAPASGTWVRVLVRGTGAAPVMGPPTTSGGAPVAFAGAANGPPGGAAAGADVAFLIERN